MHKGAIDLQEFRVLLATKFSEIEDDKAFLGEVEDLCRRARQGTFQDGIVESEIKPLPLAWDSKQPDRIVDTGRGKFEEYGPTKTLDEHADEAERLTHEPIKTGDRWQRPHLNINSPPNPNRVSYDDGIPF